MHQPIHRTRRSAMLALAYAAMLGSVILLPQSASFAAEGVQIAAPKLDETAKTGTETAIFAGGCFWGVQGVFQHVEGVSSATSGYIGGTAEDASYGTVSRGTTGHAEAVRITYDPAKVSYGELLHIFFSVVADPTTLNYQGPDHGTQYRSAIFATTGEQEKVATAYIAQLEAADAFRAPIVTGVEKAAEFYPAEDYHQDYLTLHPTSPYIIHNDLPKVADLKALFPDSYRASPVLEMN